MGAISGICRRLLSQGATIGLKNSMAWAWLSMILGASFHELPVEVMFDHICQYSRLHHELSVSTKADIDLIPPVATFEKSNCRPLIVIK